MNNAAWPKLHSSIQMMDNVDVPRQWERFEFYEAGHRALDIMNPMSAETLDHVIDVVGVSDGQRVLDIACGHGAFLLRCARRAAIEGEGVDLSPWVLNRASGRLREEGLSGRVTLTLGSGSETPAEPVWDVVCGLGMSWVWQGFEGTVAALAARTKPGGTIVVGDIYLRDSNNPTDGDPELGPQLTVDQQREVLDGIGLADPIEIPTTRADWDNYDNAVRAGIVAWTEEHPGTDYLERDNRWMEKRHLLDKVGWTVWVATKP